MQRRLAHLAERGDHRLDDEHHHRHDHDHPAHHRHGSCSRIPEETAGPYPGDGSNGPTVLSTSGVVRSDIRSSFGGLSGTAHGVPLTVVLTIVSATTCAPLAGYALYLWHCDRLGRYSLYSSGVTNQNYLRGVQEADASGRVTFTTTLRASSVVMLRGVLQHRQS